MPNVVFINDRDVETDFGFVVESLSGFPGNLSGSPRDVPLSEGPELSGGFADPKLVRRKRSTPPAVKGHLNTATVGAALPLLDAFRALLGGGEVALRTGYAPARQCLVLCEAFDGDTGVPGLLDGNITLSLLFTVPTGLASARSPEGYGLSTARTTCPLGSAASAPGILVHGGGAALTNPTVVVRNAAGDVVQSMGFTCVLGATAALYIDTTRSLVSLLTAGVSTDGLSYWTTGDFPLLRPYDAWVEDGAYPTMELTATAGTPQGELTYVRNYL